MSLAGVWGDEGKVKRMEEGKTNDCPGWRLRLSDERSGKRVEKSVTKSLRGLLRRKERRAGQEMRPGGGVV